MEADEEVALLKSAKAGDINAHGKLVLSVLPKISKLARSHAARHDYVTSDDLSQCGCLKLMVPSVIEAFVPIMPWMHYATRVADNAMRDYVRRELVRWCPSIDVEANEGEMYRDLIPGNSPGPDHYLEVKERAALFDKIAPTLTTMQQRIVEEIANEFSFAEAAERLQMNPGTLKSHLFRARQTLHPALG